MTAEPPDTAEPPSTNGPPPAAADPGTSTEQRDAAPRGDCRRLTDFDGADDTYDGWFVVNDGVMGGRSNGTIEITDSEMRFTGTVVTQGGGFTSVRRRLDAGELAGTDRLELRVRADGRTYGVTMEDDGRYGQRSISHRADLAIDDAAAASSSDGWTTVTLRYEQLLPTVFGQIVDADPFDPDQARELGIIIADGTDGDFTLAIDWIDACP